MINNQWVQSALLMGITLGLFIGSILTLLNPYVTIGAALGFCIATIFLTARVRGTDGWGGPYNNPTDP